MEDKEEEVTTTAVRKTRSGRAVKSSPATASRPKPASRKTRKKVVLMEVEVSDEEDETTNNKITEEESDQADGDKSKDASEKKETCLLKLDQNGSDDAGDVLKQISDDSVVVFNDVEMLNAEDSNDEVIGDTTEAKVQEKITADPTQSDKVKVESSRKKTEKKLVISAEKMQTDSERATEEKEEQKTEKTESMADTMKVKDGESIKEAGKESEPKIEETLEIQKAANQLQKKLDESKCSKKRKIDAEEEPLKKTKIEVTNKQVLEKETKPEPEIKLTETEAEVKKSYCENKDKKDEEKSKIQEKKMDIQPHNEEKEEIKQNIEAIKEAKPTTEGKREKVKPMNVLKDESEALKNGANESEAKTGEVKENVNKDEEIEKSKDEEKQIAKELEAKKKDERESETKKKDNIEAEKTTEIKDESKEENDKAKKDTATAKKVSNGTKKEDAKDKKISKQNGDPDAENISEDELPAVQVAKVPEAEEVSDEELPGPKRAELPADTEVVSDDELPASKTEKTETKKSCKKRKLDESNYDPCSPTSESETPTKKVSTDSVEKEKEEKKPKKLPELDKYWKAVNDDPTDFTGWTYLLQYVDQEVFERGLKAIPLSVDLWLHYLTYVKQSRADDEEYIRSQFERALAACGLEFRSDRLWDQYVKWETEGKRPQKVTAIYDRLLATPTQGYTSHFDNFQEHVASNPPNKIIEVDEFMALRKEVRQLLKHDPSTAAPGVTTGDGSSDTAAPGADAEEAPPGDDKSSPSSDEEAKAIKERIVSIRRKIHKATVNAVTARWNYEEGIKRPYFHVKPLERCQLKNWQDYLDYETEQGDRTRIIVLFERCLIACALYEEFWLKFVHYLEGVKDPALQPKIRDVYERACTIHHLKKPNLHLQWAMFEEGIGNPGRAAEILVNLEKSVPNVLQIAYRRINLERRRGDFDKCTQLYEHYINTSKNKMISSNIAIKFSRFCFKQSARGSEDCYFKRSKQPTIISSTHRSHSTKA
nr:unnamed protein product [Callosobruchus analis]